MSKTVSFAVPSQAQALGHADLLIKLSELFSKNYGIWSDKGPRPGQHIAMSTKLMKHQLLFDEEACGVVVASIGDTLNVIGQAFYYKFSTQNLGNVCWITQLVTCREFRQKGIATKLIKAALGSDYFSVCGLVTSHPYAIRALEKASSSIYNRTFIEKYSNELIQNSSLVYMDHNMIVDEHGSINTQFYIDHTEVFKIIEKEKKASRWKFGELLEDQDQKKACNMNLSTTSQGPVAPVGTSSTTSTKMKYMLPTTISLRNLLPAITFLVAFATVMTILVIHMNNTATRHHQFRVNMSKDNEFLGVAQDNPDLITYIREVHLSPAIEQHHRLTLDTANSFAAEDITYIIKLLDNKRGGKFVEAGAYSDGKTSKTEYLEKQLDWYGLLIQPEPTYYFKLKRHNRGKSQAIHACLSTTPYPKEVTFHQEDRDGVKINRIHANTIDDADWFNTRVKCFPFYSLLLAMNTSLIDLFILESGGTELQVLQTIPFERVKIEFIDIVLLTNDLDKDTIKKFLSTKNYTFLNLFNNSYVFRLNNM